MSAGAAAHLKVTHRPPFSAPPMIKIESGRMHQIRASFEYLGAFIVGDTLYSSNSGAIPERIELRSIMISLHNVNGDILTIKLPYEEKKTT